MQRKISSFFEPKAGPSASENSIPEKVGSVIENVASPSDSACKPTYPDVAKLSQNDFQSDAVKLQLLSQMWDKAAQFKFPFRYIDL
jgi:hypothetical protein